MSIYKYRAKDSSTRITEGCVEALSEKEAVEKISGLGLTPLKIQQESATLPGRAERRVPGATGRVRQREITVMSRQLASLLRSGVPILRALSILSEQSESKNLSGLLLQVRSGVEQGRQFSEILSSLPVFPPLYTAMIRAGENSGTLPQALFNIADYRSRQEELLSRFRTAMAYPVLMLLVGIGTIIFMLTFVMPRLITLYRDMGQALPLPTRVLISMSERLQSPSFWLIAGFSLLLLRILFTRWVRTPAGGRAFGRYALSLPCLGSLVSKIQFSRFSRTLELLLRSGIPVLRSLGLTLPVVSNHAVRVELARTQRNLEQGESFGKSLKNSKIIPLFVSSLVSVGEESGRLDDALREVADSYEREIDETLKTMAGLFEPLMILVMGLIVGFLVTAMLLPVFDLNIMAR